MRSTSLRQAFGSGQFTAFGRRQQRLVRAAIPQEVTEPGRQAQVGELQAVRRIGQGCGFGDLDAKQEFGRHQQAGQRQLQRRRKSRPVQSRSARRPRPWA